jgi:hypothetical protein
MRMNEPQDFRSLDLPQQANSPGKGPAARRGPGPVLVYDLRRTANSAKPFYESLAAFTREVTAQAAQRASAAIVSYRHYLVTELREPHRSADEYAIELLTIGMALRLYGEAAAETPGWVVHLAQELVFRRRRTPGAKPLIDFARAGLFQLFMTRGLRTAQSAPDAPAGSPRSARRHDFAALPRVIAWMQATGEFHHESLRLVNWLSYLRTVPPLEAEGWIETALSFYDWFQSQAQDALGDITAPVRQFLDTTWSDRFWREDQIFCGRRPAEYHLAMVASEIMNAAMREDFRAKPRKVLLVPACMRGKNAATCPARVDGPDISCASCDPDCSVSRITRTMRAEGIETYIVPHSSGFSQSLERWQREPGTAVGAVACLPNILAGGYEMRARGIASQCVPLDFPGCRKHWTDDGIPTTLDESRLVQLITSDPSNPD